tara:strand:+ start:266 stop:1150 length:885 start_codon:yes stop_codon:yes gene_type:complete
MKKKLLIISLFAATAANAQFSDDMESYALGPVHSGNWNSWSGNAGTEDAIATDYRASSGTQSMLISDGEAQDAVLDLGNKSFGVWTVNFNLFIPSDSIGYYNFQEATPVGSGTWAVNIFFNETGTANGAGIVYDDSNPSVESGTFSFPNDTWFEVSHVINLAIDSIFMSIDGSLVHSGPFYSGGNLGGIDFFSIGALHNMYIDDVEYFSGAVGIEEDKKDIELSVYPNPVNDFLNITAKENITNVIVYDMFGKEIRNINTSALTLSVNTSDLPSGSYLVKVTTGKQSKMIKVLK